MRFAVGDLVRVATHVPARGHVRTPQYVRGKTGVVERICGTFRNPEELAYGVRDGARVALYRVRFAHEDLWPTERDLPLDTVDVEIYEHWLEAVAEAVSAPAPSRDWEALERAFREAVVAKGLATARELDDRLELMYSRTSALGARMVARAWFDDAYRRRMLEDGSAAARELLGIDIGALRLIVVENTPGVHNLVVCTLCSCYPRMLLGMPPDWYKSVAYRARAVREPRVVLAEFGIFVSPEVVVRVHDSTADMRYVVLPLRPAGTEDFDEERLARLVSRDSMIGVARAMEPTES